jgi:lipopolysaccharide/colanic/teichoic acid biosynthesis glycosyltransferase
MATLSVTKEEKWTGERARAAQTQGCPSAWTVSHSKRLFDVTLVLMSLPMLLPLLLAIYLTIYISSGTPVLFRQIRIGRGGRPFTIYKFRTMDHPSDTVENSIAALSLGQVTRLGHILRRSKLDELPQVFNVLTGKMSLVGPRPKIPEQQLAGFGCRPGITGAATLAFAREEALLAQIPTQQLGDFYQAEVLPVKQQMDSDYMARASLTSDLSILLRTITGRWGYFSDAPPLRTGEASTSASCGEALEVQPLE